MTRFASAAALFLLAGSLCVMSGQSSRAAEITGAWASSPDACAQLFTVKGNRASFRTSSELAGGGFIIDGQRIRGRTANCTISRRQETKDVVHLVANCATDIMLSTVQFSLRVVDDNTIVRLYPGMADMEIMYHRCREPHD